MMNRTLVQIPIACLSILVAGCVDQSRVAVITSTMVGLEAKPPMGDGQPNPSVSLAYKRAEMAIVPVCHVPGRGWWAKFFEPKPQTNIDDNTCPANSSHKNDAYAVLGSFKMAHNWFGPLNVRQFIATGSAARLLVPTTVHVIGEVNKPGRYPYTRGLTLDEAIALAGGRNNSASDKSKNVLINGKQHVKSDDVNTSLSIQPDDVIEIPKSEWFHISGAVKNPGRKDYETGLTLEKALTLAGGRIEPGKTGKVRATQAGEKNAITRELGSNEAIFPSDIIVVEPPAQSSQ